ncbi:Mu transposase C-terminal domain-containing protein [Paenibacillus melissococcoides]|uniref:Mu transposase C-terminal domain-containing protein n=1 Tax=Paenibacillus melissococcoides TaxID=2912268 RepID=A0ABN8UIX6_9BACL|nr:Mu transposase C-terminal domain-containing protein [Paenibacillus melissococcoides]
MKKFGYEYRADELCHYIGDKVDIKWDPNDVTKLYVYTVAGKKLRGVQSRTATHRPEDAAKGWKIT